MRKQTKYRYKGNTRNIILAHIKANIDIYFTVLIIFIIGICVGVTIINNSQEVQIQSIREYVNNSIDIIKNGSRFSKAQILKQSIVKNIIIVLAIWIFGLTFFGKFFLYIITLILGITFGYTTSAFMTIFNFGQGILFFLATMLIQNIISIPALIFLIVQGIKCHNDFSSKKSNNIKYIMVKYSSYAILVTLLLIASSFIEAYTSGNLIYGIIKYL